LEKRIANWANTCYSDKIGQKTSNSVQKLFFHEVLPKETKYSIAKKYDISIDELEKKNQR
jgi:DNA-directed RNA polymerase subunit H (RpoH/RPB5)